MKKIISLIITLGVFGEITAQNTSTTQFPTKAEKDYEVKDFLAKLALPTNAYSTRIWVKGSTRFNSCKLVDPVTGAVIDSIESLNPPNYTYLFETNIQSVSVAFGNNAVFSAKDQVQVSMDDRIRLLRPEDPFSIIFYGCFEPFSIDKKTRVPKLNAGYKDDNCIMRSLFNKTALGSPLLNKKYHRVEKIYRYQQDNANASEKTIILPTTVAIIGTGDQVYVDAGYEHYKKSKLNPMSAWSVEYRPMPAGGNEDINKFTEHINKMYMHFGSFEKMNTVFRRIPSFSIWDDHEIRDGWGSQGDEYDSGKLNSKLAPFYSAARKAYIDHQWILGNSKSEEVYENNNSLHQELNINGKRCFVFDLRSNRNVSAGIVINDDQMKAFKDFLERSKPGEEILLISSIPLFLGYKQIAYSAPLILPELTDDLTDGWDSAPNQKQRDEIVSAILQARLRNVKPYIISGDVHSGAILEIWYNEKRPGTTCVDSVRRSRKVLAYEIIASGLNHETLNQKENPGFILRAQKSFWNPRSNEDLIASLKSEGKEYTISNISRIDQACLNFSAFEFTKDETLLHLFMNSHSNANNRYIEEFIIKPEWEKKDIDDRKYMGNVSINCKHANYGAALSHFKRNIFIGPNVWQCQ